MEKLANKKVRGDCLWDGSSYPKTKRSHGPHQDGLEHHIEPLTELLRLEPNGYPDGYQLAAVWHNLHEVYKMLDDCPVADKKHDTARSAPACR